MKAIVCKAYGPPGTLAYDDVPAPTAGPGQVRVEVAAAGVNFPDLLIIEGKYQFKPEPPFTPGGECAGRVVEVGDGVTDVRVGERVIVGTIYGAFAEQIVVGPERLIKTPDGMDDVTAAGFTLTYATAIHALAQRAKLQPHETLLVLGAAGGVGLAAVEVGKAMGARVIAAASTDEKLALCKQHGADETVNYTRERLRDAVKSLTGGAGADVIFDPVGGDLFDESMRCINWEGRLLVVGFASGRIPQVPANLVLLKGCQVVGVFWGAFTGRDPDLAAANVARLFDWHAQGKLRPNVSHRFPLARAGEALEVVARREALGKVVLTTGKAT